MSVGTVDCGLTNCCGSGWSIVLLVSLWRVSVVLGCQELQLTAFWMCQGQFTEIITDGRLLLLYSSHTPTLINSTLPEWPHTLNSLRDSHMMTRVYVNVKTAEQFIHYHAAPKQKHLSSSYLLSLEDGVAAAFANRDQIDCGWRQGQAWWFKADCSLIPLLIGPELHGSLSASFLPLGNKCRAQQKAQ